MHDMLVSYINLPAGDRIVENINKHARPPYPSRLTFIYFFESSTNFIYNHIIDDGQLWYDEQK
jgi:hypothetical protein